MKKKFFSLVTAFLMVCSLSLHIPELYIGTNAATTLLWPVPGTNLNNLSQGYHERSAIDISASGGSTIVAALGGTVTHVFTCTRQHYGDLHLKRNYADGCDGFGTGIVIKGDDGRVYQYCHMQANSIPSNIYVNARVEQGQMIGKVGTTGNSSGNHLHFGITLSNYYTYNDINPQNESYIYEIHTHSYSSTITKQPNCTEDGVRTYSCSCGSSYTEAIGKLGHNYSTKTVPPTITEKGYSIHTCSRCGHSHKDSYVDAPLLKDDGWYYCSKLPSGVTASDYEIQYKNNYEKIQENSPGADWKNAGTVQDEWVNTGNAYRSLTELPTSDSRVLVTWNYFHFCGANAGVYANYEQTGNYVHEDTVGWGRVWVASEGWDSDGNIPYYILNWNGGSDRVYCESGTTCDGSYGTHGQRAYTWYKQFWYQDRTHVVKYKFTKTSGWTSSADSSADSTEIRFRTKHDHSYTSKITKAATCKEAGVKTFTCLCGDSYTESIPKLTTHTFANWTTTKEATCAAEGTQSRKCTVCGKTETKSIAKTTTHSYTSKVIAPTATAQGYTLHTCSVCGTSYKDNYTDIIPDEESGQLVIGNTTANAGRTVTVDVNIKNNPGIIALRAKIIYDKNALTLTKAEIKDFSDVFFGPLDADEFIIGWGDSINGNNNSNGVVARLTFKVDSKAAEKIYPICIKYDADDIYNNSLNNVIFITVDGAINVASYIAGDVNKDGKINMKDYSTLQQYLSGWAVSISESSADVNADGKINMKDYSLLQQYLSGWSVKLG